MAVIARGEIRWFRFDRPDKRRPVLVVARDELLPGWSLVPVIPLSSQIRGLAWEVRLSQQDGLPSESVLKPEWIRAVDRAKLGPRIAMFPSNRWGEVRKAMLHVFGLDMA